MPRADLTWVPTFEPTPDQIADVEAAGVIIPAAPPGRAQRHGTRERIIAVGGGPRLATRDGARFKIAGALERVVADAPP